MRLIRLFSSLGSYWFPPEQTELSDNFGNVVTRTQRMPGMSGSFDEFGMGRAPAESGNLRFAMWLEAGTPAALRRMVDAARALTDWPLSRLFIDPHDGDGPRWTWARVSNVTDPENVYALPHKRMKVTFDIQCASSRWFSRAGVLWSNDGLMSDTALMGTVPQVDQAAVEAGDMVSVFNAGDALALARIRWEGDGVDDFTDPVIRRVNPHAPTQILDEAAWTGTIGATDVVEIDGRAKSVKPTYAQLGTRSADWLVIPAGTTALEIDGTFPGEGLLTIDWWDTWV